MVFLSKTKIIHTQNAHFYQPCFSAKKKQKQCLKITRKWNSDYKMYWLVKLLTIINVHCEGGLPRALIPRTMNYKPHIKHARLTINEPNSYSLMHTIRLYVSIGDKAEIWIIGFVLYYSTYCYLQLWESLKYTLVTEYVQWLKWIINLKILYDNNIEFSNLYLCIISTMKVCAT